MLLEKQRRGNGERVGCLPFERRAANLADPPIDVLEQRGTGRIGILPVDIAAIATDPARQRQAQLVGDQRGGHRCANLARRRAVLRGRPFGLGIEVGGAQAGLGGDEAHRAAFGPGAKQRALRSAQHLDPLQIEHRGERIGRGIADLTALDWRIVDIDAGGCRADGRTYTPNGDIGLIAKAAGIELDARRLAHQPRDVLDAAFIEHLLRKGADAQRHLAHGFGMAGGRHDDFTGASLGCASRTGLRQCRCGRRYGDQRRRSAEYIPHTDPSDIMIDLWLDGVVCAAAFIVFDGRRPIVSAF